MFLTGFDATTLNTLWVDKNLRAHGLIQAYSRTNRILNSVKTYGNIVSFRDLEEQTNDAIALFGNKDARGIVLLEPVRRVLRRVRREGRRADRPLPARGRDRRRGRRRRRSSPCSARSCGCGTSWSRSTSSPATRSCPTAQLQDYQSLYLDLYAEFRTRRRGREGVDQRRRRLRDRAHQAGRDQRRLHPDARREAPRRARRRHRQRDPRRRSTAPSTPAPPCATRRTSSRPSSTP